MNSQGNGQSVSYRVSVSAATKIAIKELHHQELEAGRGQRFLAALRQIFGRLAQDPLTFDEPLYRLSALNLEVRTCALSPVLVDYAVHAEKKLVFIRGVKALPR